MKKVIDYQILFYDCIESMRQSVLDLLKEGYVPQGGICISYDPEKENEWYFQAMVKHE